MNIDLSQFKSFWFEDMDGRKYDEYEQIPEGTRFGVTYHIAWPCRFTETIDSYAYHPKNKFIQFLCRNEKFYRWISKGKPLTFEHIMTGEITYNSKWSQDCIVAMVNSGDYTLEQAIWVYVNSCERCMNVLLYKYLGGKEGYPEFSEEWKKSNTVCQFCKDIKEEDAEVEVFSIPTPATSISTDSSFPFKLNDTIYEVCECDDKVVRMFEMTIKAIRPYGAVRWIKDKEPTIWHIYAEDRYCDFYGSMYNYKKDWFTDPDEAKQELMKRTSELARGVKKVRANMTMTSGEVEVDTRC